MCGIVGYSGPEQPGRLRAICDVIAHRGPDAEGFLDESPIHFGHRRLAIQDLSDAGRQPMESADGRYVIVYNGEIYNAPELRQRLEKLGHRFRSTCDTEILVELLALEGTTCLASLNGIFAFALWDRATRRLTLARDHFGVKPLYYALEAGQIYFCSELKGLLQFPQVDRSLDPLAVDQYLTFLWVPQPRTILQRVHQVAPGHFAVYDADAQSFRQQVYWDLATDAVAATPLETTDLDTLTDMTDSLLRQAVHRQMLSDVPVGAFLSGGLDSSLIVAHMRDRAMGKVNAYTIEVNERDSRESGFTADLPYARQVAQHLGVDLEVIRVEPNIAEELPRTLYYLDEPAADPAVMNAYLICKLAREHGTVVMLSGVGGDELFAGYRRHLATRLESWLDRLPPAVRRAAAWAGQAASPRWLPAQWRPALRRVRKLFPAIEETPTRRLIQAMYWSTIDVRDSAYTDDFHALVNEADPGVFHQELLDRVSHHSVLRQALYLDLMTFMPSLNLAYNDRMAMRVSVETRVPYLDLDLVRFAWRLPDHYKLRGLTTKYILKRAARSILPRSVIHRPKTGFGVPLHRWLTRDLEPMLRDTLSPARLRRRGMLDPHGVEQVIRAQHGGVGEHTYFLWALFSLEIWADQVLGT